MCALDGKLRALRAPKKGYRDIEVVLRQLFSILYPLYRSIPPPLRVTGRTNSSTAIRYVTGTEGPLTGMASTMKPLAEFAALACGLQGNERSGTCVCSFRCGQI